MDGIVSKTGALVSKITSSQADKIGQLLTDEMSSMDRAIEKAAQRIAVSILFHARSIFVSTDHLCMNLVGMQEQRSASRTMLKESAIAKCMLSACLISGCCFLTFSGNVE